MLISVCSGGVKECPGSGQSLSGNSTSGGAENKDSGGHDV